MADDFEITVDASGVIAAVTALGAAAQPYVKAAAKVTADNIAGETDRRFARREGGPTRGGRHTAEGITVEETHNGDGWVVYVKSPDMPHLPAWLEFGTRFMTAHPAGGALFPSARLEESAHLRRISDALAAAIDATGLGE